ncbi:30S ribosomal protein S6 [bacterium]|nr:30S ribosomal protein S6 [bacterium]MCP5462787.1 30S ribosomal protein S6 [bacterium]
MFIVDSAVDVENNGSNVLEEIKSEIARQEGEIVSIYPLGKRTFAYPIKKKRDGIYYVIYFDIDPQRITKFKERIKINSNVLREMIVVPHKVPYPEELLKNFARRVETGENDQKDAAYKLADDEDIENGSVEGFDGDEENSVLVEADEHEIENNDSENKTIKKKRPVAE